MFNNFPPQFIYLASNLFLLSVWLTAFLIRADLRRKMLTMGIIFTPLGPLTEVFYARDYWRPLYALGSPFIIEDLLFGFLAGSGASCIYMVFTNSTPDQTKGKSNHFALAGLITTFFITFAVLNLLFRINSIWASVISLFLLGLIISGRRPDLRKPSLVSSLCLGGCTVFGYAFLLRLFPSALKHLWLLYGTKQGITVFGLPLTEIAWSMATGFGLGALCEFWQGTGIVKRNIKAGH